MTKQINYAQLSEELDRIIAKIQDGAIDIDEASKLYESGMKIISEIEDYLKNAENKVTKIKKSFE